MRPKGKMVIGQSGGPTMVINCTVIGAVQQALESEEIDGIYGALNGLRGVLDENLVDLARESRQTLEGVAETPAAALGTVRLKMVPEHHQRVLDVFQAHNVRYFFYIGGNDSMVTCLDIHNLAQSAGYEMRVIGIPKTIDNDLPHTDHCPGYGSAARLLLLATKCISRDNESMRRIHVIEAMGRDAGWLTAASALAREERGDPPHLIYPPERPFRQEAFLSDVERVYARLGHAQVVVSEGVKNEQGELLAASSTIDSFGHPHLGGVGQKLASLAQAELKVTARSDSLGTLQRSFMPCVSGTDQREAFHVGRGAVREALKGATAQMVTLERVRNHPYSCRTGLVHLNEVAFQTRTLPRKYLSAGRPDVTPSFREYLQPLVRPPASNPLSLRFRRLRGYPVKKRLHPYQA